MQCISAPAGGQALHVTVFTQLALPLSENCDIYGLTPSSKDGVASSCSQYGLWLSLRPRITAGCAINPLRSPFGQGQNRIVTPITASLIRPVANAIQSGLEIIQCAVDVRRLQGPLQNAPMIGASEKAGHGHEPHPYPRIDGISHLHPRHRSARQSRAGWPVLRAVGLKLGAAGPVFFDPSRIRCRRSPLIGL